MVRRSASCARWALCTLVLLLAWGCGPDDGQPACQPTTCSAQTCGLINDGCGGVLFCGSCASPDIDIEVPPDPTTLAPPLNETEITPFCEADRFLYAGPVPIQLGVSDGTIECGRSATLRGRVRTRAGVPLPGVLVSVLDHPELGATVTRMDGRYDLVANGGGGLTLEFASEGYLPSQRTVTLAWNHDTPVEDVVLVALDPVVNEIDPSTGTTQVARGSQISDNDGQRQATVIFPDGGTVVTMEMPDGSEQTLTGPIHVRATEFTVGNTGPAAMPGSLPPTSAYTYALELSVDEAMAAGARNVRFEPPVTLYVENFVGIPVGERVPTGAYDRSDALWKGEADGRVLEMLDVDGNGLATLDVDGSGSAADAATLASLGITDSERTELAKLYQPGDTVWRTPIAHFTPWDCNYPMAPPEDAGAPDVPQPEEEGPEQEHPCNGNGSIIECQTQVLGDRLPIAGTPFNLSYRSNRMPGFEPTRSTDIPLTTDTVPPSLKRVEAEITIGGRTIRRSFDAPTANLSTKFVWDGLDAYGREIQGSRRADIRIKHYYDVVYQASVDAFESSWASVSGVPYSVSGREEIAFEQREEAVLGGLNATGLGLGGWTLDVHRVYDPNVGILYGGDGSFRRLGSQTVISTVAGTGAGGVPVDGVPATQSPVSFPRDVAVAPDGTLYIAQVSGNRIRKVDTTGIITTAAGGGTDFNFDIPATTAQLVGDQAVAVDSKGTLYFTTNRRVATVDADGILRVVAGTGGQGGTGDGGPALDATITFPESLAVGPDGAIYVGDQVTRRVRKFHPGGTITTVAGDGSAAYDAAQDEGGPAIEAGFTNLHDIEVDDEGNLYIADASAYRVLQVGKDGIVRTFAGTGVAGSADYVLATQGPIRSPFGLGAGFGNVYVTTCPQCPFGNCDPGACAVKKITSEGLLEPLAGGTTTGYGGDGGPALAALLNAAGRGDGGGIAVDGAGSVYFADRYNHRVRKIGTTPPGATAAGNEILIPDGGQLLAFDGSGRHLRTLDGRTGNELYTFGYDAAGFLTGVTDRYGNTTTIERGPNGKPTGIRSPGGALTQIELDSDDRLSKLINPDNGAHELEYDANGLLARSVDPNGQESTYEYDVTGRLSRATNRGGTTRSFERMRLGANQYDVTMTTTAGRTQHYGVDRLKGARTQLENSFPGGSIATRFVGADGTTQTTRRDGTMITVKRGPDPRFGMLQPIAQQTSVTVPSGQTLTVARARTVALADPTDPFSLLTETETTDVAGQITTTVWDAVARQTTTTTPLGRQRLFTFDIDGRPVSAQLGNLDPVFNVYDAQGRLSEITQGTGVQERTVTMGYSPGGYLTSLTDPLGETSTFTRDAAGRVTQITRPAGGTVEMTYDANGNLTSITAPAGGTHTFEHTPMDELAKYTPPGSMPTLYEYDEDHRLSKLTLPSGDLVTISYDTAGRVVSRVSPAGTITRAYDASGRVNTITAADGGTLTLGYDGSLVTSRQWSGAVSGTVSTGYDSQLRLYSQSINQGSTYTIGYDAEGVPATIGALTVTRDPTSGLVTDTTVGVTNQNRGYNAFGELDSYTTTDGAGTILSADFTPDVLGRHASETRAILGVQTVYDYFYDAAGRLTGVDADGQPAERYTYDLNGNRLTADVGGQMVSATYDSADRLLTHGGTTYEYNALGQRTKRTSGGTDTVYTYDERGVLLGVVLPNGDDIDYVIDGRGRRIGKRVNGVLQKGWLYADGTEPVAELDATGALVSRFVAGYFERGGSTYRLITDERGSVRLVVDASDGSVVQRIDYDAFGRVVNDTNPGFQPFGFAGGHYDPDTRLVRFGARDYDAEVGRWTTPDPIGFRGRKTNLYAYSGNDPVNQIDPTGLAAVTLAGLASAVVTVAAIYWLAHGIVDVATNRPWSPELTEVMEYLGRTDVDISEIPLPDGKDGFTDFTQDFIFVQPFDYFLEKAGGNREQAMKDLARSVAHELGHYDQSVIEAIQTAIEDAEARDKYGDTATGERHGDIEREAQRQTKDFEPRDDFCPPK